LHGEKGSQGDAFFTAPNPPFGAVFTYYLRDALKTRKQLRQEQEAEIKKSEGDTPYPGFDALKQEEREEQPLILLTITDPAGQVVQRITGPTEAGFHRVAWDLRYAPYAIDQEKGPLALPGDYQVTAAKRVDDVTTQLGTPQSFEVAALDEPAATAPPPAVVLAFQKQAGELLRTVVAAQQRLQEALDQLAQMKQAVRAAPYAPLELFDEARRLELRLLDARDRLSGDTTRTERAQVVAPSIVQRARLAYTGGLYSPFGPTQTHRQAYQIAGEQFQQLRSELDPLLDVELAQLKQKLDAAGVPWTTGRAQ
jgi:hypothetical protein